MASVENLKIGEFVINPSRGVLTGAEGEVALEPKVVDVLLTLAAKPGEVVSRDELVEAVWKTEFGADERVTRAISLLRKAFGDERGAARYIETVPKRGYRLVARVEAAAGTTMPAAATQVPEAAEQPSATMPPPTTTQPRTQWRLFAAAVGFMVVLGVVATAAFRSSDAQNKGFAPDLVELEPLRVIDAKPGDDAIVQRMQVSLKRVLASNQVVLVDRSTAKPVSGAASTQAEFTLSGTLEQSATGPAVTVYLDSKKDGQTLWSQRYSRAASDVENLREAIAINTAFVIRCALEDRRAAKVKPSAEAFKIYLRICEPEAVWALPSEHLMLAQRLSKIAPDDPYGYALEAFAAATALSEGFELSKSEAEALMARVQRASARAFELDPGNTLAQIALLISLHQSKIWLRQDELIRASLDHPIAREYYLPILRATGRLSEAMHVARQLASDTALSPDARRYVAVLHMQQGDPKAAERTFQDALRIWPDNETLRFYRFANAAFYGDAVNALKLLEGLEHDDAYNACYRAFIEARANGGQARDLATLRKACVLGDPTEFQYLARMLAALGDVDGAYDALKTTPLDWPGSTVFLFYPEMAAFRKDARFMPFIAPSGLLEAWIKTDRWPDFCSDRTMPYDCKAAAKQALAMKP